MTNEDIRKLLGGYATNTLTEAERKVLFEAALDNQELFNAMQEEQALKDLLSDPISREQVRQALETPAPAKQAAAWWPQWWAWGSAAGAVVAAVVIVAVIRSNPSELHRKEVAAVTAMTAPVSQPTAPALKSADQSASTFAKNRTVSPKPEPPPPAKTFRPPPSIGARNEGKDEVAAAMPPPPVPRPPAAPAPAEVRESAPNRFAGSAGAPGGQNAGHSQDQVSQNTAANAQNAISNQVLPRPQQFQPQQEVNARSTSQMVEVTAGVGGFVSGPLRYSLIKRASNGDFVPVQANPDLKKGDAVQLRIVPALSGYVSLSQLDQAGTWRRVFPSSGPGIPVAANSAYTLPAAPIEVSDKDERFRVTLSLATPETKAATSETVNVDVEKDMKSKKRARVATLAKPAPEPSPLFVDITIGPKNQQ